VIFTGIALYYGDTYIVLTLRGQLSQICDVYMHLVKLSFGRIANFSNRTFLCKLTCGHKAHWGKRRKKSLRETLLGWASFSIVCLHPWTCIRRNVVNTVFWISVCYSLSHWKIDIYTSMRNRVWLLTVSYAGRALPNQQIVLRWKEYYRWVVHCMCTRAGHSD